MLTLVRVSFSCWLIVQVKRKEQERDIEIEIHDSRWRASLVSFLNEGFLFTLSSQLRSFTLFDFLSPFLFSPPSFEILYVLSSILLHPLIWTSKIPDTHSQSPHSRSIELQPLFPLMLLRFCYTTSFFFLFKRTSHSCLVFAKKRGIRFLSSHFFMSFSSLALVHLLFNFFIPFLYIFLFLLRISQRDPDSKIVWKSNKYPSNQRQRRASFSNSSSVWLKPTSRKLKEKRKSAARELLLCFCSLTCECCDWNESLGESNVWRRWWQVVVILLWNGWQKKSDYKGEKPKFLFPVFIMTFRIKGLEKDAHRQLVFFLWGHH